MPIDPPPRRGRRDNGLDAVAFVPLADVDPRVGEHLLDVLRAAGVPAYLEPSADIEPYTRTLALPSPPTDRLWVDREQRLAARQIVEAEAAAAQSEADRGPDRPPEDRPSAGLPDADEELVWREIVASFGSDSKPPVPPWPVEEDADRPPPATAGEPRPTGDDPDAEPGRRRRRPGLAGGDTDDLSTGAADPDAADADELVPDDEGHYEPPPPPPVPRPSRQAMLGLILIAVGILLLAAPGLLDLGRRDGMFLGVVAVLSGGAVLVYRLRDSRSDDGPDDGAVV